MTKGEIIASVGQERYDTASAILKKRISGPNPDLPHDVSPMVWDAPLSRFEQIRLFFELYDDLPSYGMLMYATMAYSDFEESAREVWWRECLARVSRDDDVLREPILYALWCDYFEDPDLAADVWSRVTAGEDPRVIEAILRVSGPVPWPLKASLYEAAARDASLHRALLGGLIGSAFDAFGEIELGHARELLARLQVTTDEPGYRELRERLAG